MAYLKNPPKGWLPPFCPNGNCKYHHPLPDQWYYKKFGSYVRVSDNRSIRRFRCLHCKRTFSTQTFSATYWQKRPELDAEVFSKIVNGMCKRQIARDLGVDPATVNHKTKRLGRHCLLFLQRELEGAPPAKDIVFDGLETFEFSQYYPFHHNVAVEKDTDFVLFFNDSELRRKGRMTQIQKRRRLELEKMFGRPDPRAIEKAVTEMLSEVISGHDPVNVYTDDHTQYRNPIRAYNNHIIHHVTPGKAHRDADNSLWEINLFDSFLRHSSKNHTRETIAWSKRRQASSEQLAVYTVWRNYINIRRQKERWSPTPAMERGMMTEKLTIADVLSGRIFIRHVELADSWNDYYYGDVHTRALPLERKHRLAYAE